MAETKVTPKVEPKKLSIFQKIQKAKMEFQKEELKKTRFNPYGKFYYFDLSDFLPRLNSICGEFGLYNEFHFGKEEATLTIYNTDDIEETPRQWNTPIVIVEIKGCSNMQGIGGTQTFAKKQLYGMAYDITESDLVDGGEIDEFAEEGKKKINKVAIQTIKNIIAETEGDMSKFLAFAEVKKVEDIINSQLPICMKALEKQQQNYKPKPQPIEDMDF